MMISRTLKFSIALLVLLGMALANDAHAQLVEPEVKEALEPKTPFSEDKSNEYGLDLFVNNFGFGLGVHYAKYVGPFTAITFRSGITGVRDDSEQTFQSYFTGNKVIPNKYKRAFGFPFLMGIKHRIFPAKIEDNFRVFVSAGLGPAMVFTYPYLQDKNNNGFRDFRLIKVRGGGSVLRPVEQVNDFFSGWKNGSTHWGFNGEIKIGADLGSSFGGQTTVEIGYFFYYLKDGLQIMEPYKPYGYTEPDGSDPGFPIACMKNNTAVPCQVEGANRNSFNPAQKYFGTPQIKVTIGGMW
ncbi:hypothetical protein [Fodinibius halophilus]|uniref:Outer membrane beta-barrel protein n=1 Tax=Fodinibius halophilus TaxID=1736908 RepID=A0A6M1T0I8_9BACT|nr:hypothetical protein [Fodinibius halophilus]NGP88996.1 hypothetical protein [Fodinibius halophilus]